MGTDRGVICAFDGCLVALQGHSVGVRGAYVLVDVGRQASALLCEGHHGLDVLGAGSRVVVDVAILCVDELDDDGGAAYLVVADS
jgi:hypothetical protein